MINSFTTFSKAIARTNIETKSPSAIDLDEDYDLLVRIKIGLIFDKIINHSCFLINFCKNISTKLSNIHNDSRKEIISNLQKILIIHPKFYEMIENAFENIDEDSDENSKDQIIILKQHTIESLKNLRESFENIEEIISEISEKRSSIEKKTRILKEELSTIINQYQLIIRIVQKYESIKSKMYENLEVSSSEEKTLTLVFLLSSLIDDITLKFHCFSNDSLFNEVNDDSSIINRIIDTLNVISEKNFQLSYNSQIKTLNEVIELKNKFEEVTKFINNLFDISDITEIGIINNNEEKYHNLIDIATSISTIYHVINEIEVRSSYYELNNLIRSLSTNFFNKNSFEDSISTAKQLIDAFSHEINILTETEITKNNLLAAFNSLSFYLDEKCTDRDSSSFGLISTVRIIAQIYPDSEIAEILLENLYKTVSKITKSFVSKCKKHVNQFMAKVDDNLEYFESRDLNDSNYYFTAINGINEDDFIADSDQFISIQQQFFDYFCSSYRTFKQMTLNCQNEELRTDFELITNCLLKIGIRYSNWINQFYSIIGSIAHLRSKLILDSFSFPIFLLNPSLYNDNLDEEDSESYSESDDDDEKDERETENEEEEEESEQIFEKTENINLINTLSKNVSNLQKILDKTPQFLLCDIIDIHKLVKTIANIANNFRSFIILMLNMEDSPFYPIINLAIVSITEILSRKLPNSLINILSLANFNDKDYFYCSMNASATYSLFILKEINEIIKKEKIISSLYMSPSFFLVLSAINIAEFPTNKENAKKIISNLSMIFNYFQILWLKSVQFSLQKQTKQDKNDIFSLNLNSLIDSLKDFLKYIDQLSQPSIPYKIPKPIYELKQYKHTISLIDNKSVIKFAQFLIQTLYQKRIVNKNSHNFLNSWFNNVLSLLIKFNQNHIYMYEEIEKQFIVLEGMLTNYNKCNIECYSNYIKYLANSSIFIAYKEDEFSSENIHELHKKIILLSKQYFAFNPKSKKDEFSFIELHKLNELILEIYDSYCKIFYEMKYFDYSNDEILKISYKNAIQIINYVLKQKKLKETDNHHQININIPYYIKYLNELNFYEISLCNMQKNENDQASLISELINYVCEYNQNYNKKNYDLCTTSIENENKNDYSYESKLLFSCISNYNKHFLVQNNSIDFNEKDEFSNKVKNKCFQFRGSILNYIKSSQKILIDSNENEIKIKKEMNDYICNAYQSINTIPIMICDFLKTIDSQRKSVLFIQNFSEIQVLFIKLISFLSKIKSTKSDSFNVATKKLKKIALKINEINKSIFQSDEVKVKSIKNKHKEEEGNEEDDNDEYEKEESKNLLSVFSELIFSISKLNELASFSFISEMYENGYIKSSRDQLIKDLNDSLSKLKEESLSDEFYELIISSSKKFIEETNNINFNLHSEYYKNLIQQINEKSEIEQDIIIEEEEEEVNSESDAEDEILIDNDDGIIDSEFMNICQLSPLLSPQLQIFNSIYSIMKGLFKEKILSETEEKLKPNLSLVSFDRNHFPSKPNLLKSYFLAADVDPYIGFRNDEDDLNRLTFSKYSEKGESYEEQNEIQKRIVGSELENNSLYEKHIRRYGVAMKQANDSYNELSTILTKFNEISNDKKSTNGELIDISEKLKDASDDYSEKILQITYFSKQDKAFQVEQLIELHKYKDSFNELQEAVKQKLANGNEMIHNLRNAIAKHEKLLGITADQFKQYNYKHFKQEGKKDENKKEEENNKLENEIDQEITVLMKLSEFHNKIKQILKDVNMIIEEDKGNESNDLNKSIGPIMFSIEIIIKRARVLTRNRIINAKRDELKRNPVLIDSKGNITRRTNINQINIKLENEDGLIRAAHDLQNAAKQILVCLDETNSKNNQNKFNFLQISNHNSHDYKIISSLSSIKNAITDLITQILFIGGDPEKIMNKEVKELTDLLNSLTEKAERKCYEKISQNYIQDNEKIFTNSKDDEISKRISPLMQSLEFNYRIHALKSDLESKKFELESFNHKNK